MPKVINFVCTSDNSKVSGGYIYNEYLLRGLEQKGYEVKHYHAANINDMSSADHTIVDSIAVNDCAPHLLDLNSPPILLCHLPPEMQVDKIPYGATRKQTSVEKLIRHSKVVSTGTSCTHYMRRNYNLCKDQMHMVMPGLVDNWKYKSSYQILPKKLLVVANLIPNKGYEMLFDVMAALKHLEWSLDIYGESSFAPEYASKILGKIDSADLRDRISYHGVVNQTTLNNAMTNADLFIQLSPFEPYSMVSLEAICSNLPMLSSLSGEYSDFNQSGLVKYIPELTNECCQAILEELLTTEGEYAKLCQHAAIDKRGWTQVVDEFEQLLEAV